MSIRMFKVVTGEFILGDVNGESASDISISNPMVVHFAPHPSGQLALNLFPFNPFAASKDENVSLNKEHVMFETVGVQDGLQKEYVRITSGIVTVGNPEVKLVTAK